MTPGTFGEARTHLGIGPNRLGVFLFLTKLFGRLEQHARRFFRLQTVPQNRFDVSAFDTDVTEHCQSSVDGLFRLVVLAAF